MSSSPKSTSPVRDSTGEVVNTNVLLCTLKQKGKSTENAAGKGMASSISPEQAEYDAFLEKVKRTIYVDSLTPKVTDKVVKAAFNQFGEVKSIEFIPDYLETNKTQCSVLVEMGDEKQAKNVVAEMEKYCLMVAGMPRPARARAAEPAMFHDRPRKPGRKIFCRWVDPKEPDFAVAMKMKKMVKQQAAEASFLLEAQQAEEEKLHKQQSENLNAQYKKFELIEKVHEDGTANRLGSLYNSHISDA